MDGKREILDRGYAIHEVLRIRSLTQTADGLLVRRSKDAGFEDGDLLVAIDGRPVWTFGDLQERTDLDRPGRTAKLTVVRDGERIDLVHHIGGGDAPRTRTTVDVDLSLMKNRTDEQRALLAAIVRG